MIEINTFNNVETILLKDYMRNSSHEVLAVDIDNRCSDFFRIKYHSIKYSRVKVFHFDVSH